MSIQYAKHQLQEPLHLGPLFDEDGVETLADIAKTVRISPYPRLRSQRRVLLSSLRYMRTHGIGATASEWNTFAEFVASMPLVWDEASNGRYRYRIAGLSAMPPPATRLLLISTLEQTPPGWQASQQTRQHYRYVARHLPEKRYVARHLPEKTSEPPKMHTMHEAMRALVAEKFPSIHTSFMNKVVARDVSNLFDPKKRGNINQTWLQAAFALARFPGEPALIRSIQQSDWYNATPQWQGKDTAILADAGISLSLFEILQRLPVQDKRPAWMADAFIKMLPCEKDAESLARGWKAMNFSEAERFDLLASLAKDYPTSKCGQPLAKVLQWTWTLPLEERKAQALQAYATFGANQVDTHFNVMLDNTKEWLVLLVPELEPLLDLVGGSPLEEMLQMQQFLEPSDSASYALPAEFECSDELNGLTK